MTRFSHNLQTEYLNPIREEQEKALEALEASLRPKMLETIKSVVSEWQETNPYSFSYRNNPFGCDIEINGILIDCCDIEDWDNHKKHFLKGFEDDGFNHLHPEDKEVAKATREELEGAGIDWRNLDLTFVKLVSDLVCFGEDELKVFGFYDDPYVFPLDDSQEID